MTASTLSPHTALIIVSDVSSTRRCTPGLSTSALPSGAPRRRRLRVHWPLPAAAAIVAKQQTKQMVAALASLNRRHTGGNFRFQNAQPPLYNPDMASAIIVHGVPNEEEYLDLDRPSA